MAAIVDDQRRETEGTRAFGKCEKTEFEGGVGKSPLGVDSDNGRTLVQVEFRHCSRLDLARLHGPQGPLDTIDPMRLAGVTLACDDDACKRPRLLRIEAGLPEDGIDPPVEIRNRDGGCLGHIRFSEAGQQKKCLRFDLAYI